MLSPILWLTGGGGGGGGGGTISFDYHITTCPVLYSCTYSKCKHRDV